MADRPTAVICEADAVLARALDEAVQEAGFDVIAVTDTPFAALAAIERATPDLVIADVGPGFGAGREVALEAIRRSPTSEVLCVHDEGAVDLDSLAAAGIAGAIERGRIGELTQFIGARSRPSSVDTLVDRRRPVRRNGSAVGLPETPRVVAWSDFRSTVVDALRPGDSILGLDVLAPGAGIERRLELRAKLLRSALAARRDGDEVAVNDVGLPVVALFDGHTEAPLAVHGRLAQRWRDSVSPGIVGGAFAHVSERRGGVDQLRRVVDVLERDGLGLDRPIKML